jgi:thiamine biosynthesis lipoprotein
MGTQVTVVAPSLDPAAEQIVTAAVSRDFETAERRYSRFRADSELATLHRADGPVRVSAPHFSALWRARGYHALTDGLFDPCIGGAIASLGYDRDFAPGALDRAETAPLPVRTTMAEIDLDPRSLTVAQPPGTRLDLGGMIKGFTADRAARRLPSCGAVDAGGDAVLRGTGPDGRGWLVDVEDPCDPEGVVVTLRARDRAVATSAPNRRRWRAGGREQHHLIDPRTQRPAVTDLLQVTVLAPAAELAEVLTKAAFFLGARAARRFLERVPNTGAVLVRRDGGVEIAGDVEVERDAA